MAAGAYLVLSVVVWWNVWSAHPTSVTTCGCGDSSLFTWFLEWPAYALSHGFDPLFSTAMFHPTGVNLLANTSELAFGVVLTPVTWIFGPIATLNVALTLSPVLSAFGMFVLLRKWVRWTPAAFVGGLLYGFSPLVLTNLTDAHLMVATLVVPPLVVGCLDELLVRQRRSPILTGVALGLLLGVQYFIGTEVLAITVITGLVGVILLLLYGARHPAEVRQRRHHAVVGLVAGGVATVVALAYPVWFTLSGPAHLTGAVWSDQTDGFSGTVPKDYLFPSTPSSSFAAITHNLGGYQGLTSSGQYFGIGLILVILVGLVVWRLDRRLWLFGTIGVATVALSLGRERPYWVPWRLLARVPLIQNIIPSRFLTMTYLVAAIMLALVVDHTRSVDWDAVIRRMRGGEGPSAQGGRPKARRTLVAVAAALVVSGVALVPLATYEAGGLPLTTASVSLPPWFSQVAPHLRGDQVLLAYPVPFATLQSALTWQAVDRMQFSIAGGAGPGATLSRAGAEREGQEIIAASSLSFDPLPEVTPAEVGAVRHALVGWGVTMVVIPNQPELPTYAHLESAPYAVGLITAATGELPTYQADAWVWTGVEGAGPPVTLTSQAFQHCVGATDGHPPTIADIPACVLANASPPS